MVSNRSCFPHADGGLDLLPLWRACPTTVLLDFIQSLQGLNGMPGVDVYYHQGLLYSILPVGLGYHWDSADIDVTIL
jgi:hypothetical protein